MAATCPHCRSADVQALAEEWQCLNCQTHFVEGDQPERKGGGKSAPPESKKSGVTTSKDVLKKGR
ncbi:MAG TPA: hypothetical protein VMZ51_08175 [Acidimicrobiales bacterium]|nr:hypothetical protein [Acidimicrobiales bacterium]